MFVKVLTVIGFVAVASAADLSVGYEGGKLIFEQNVTASPAIWRQVKTLTVNATNTTDEVISRVVVTDNRPEKDGEATVIEGGEGQKNVTLELKSPAVFRGLDFYVQVFAAEENVNARLPNHPKATGDDTQNPQVPKDLNVNENQEPKNGDDFIFGAPKPTDSSTAETNKDDQQKINPALVGKDQTRLNRDTQEQKTKDLTPIPTPVEVDATKDIKVNENANKTVQAEIDENLKKALDSVFESNSTQNNEDTQKVISVMPQAESDDLINLREDEENRKVRQATKEPVVPALPKELTNDDHTTPKSEVSNTTEKHVGLENTVPRIVPVTGDSSVVSSTTPSDKFTTKLPENVKTTQLKRNVKGHHFGHITQHAVPVPQVPKDLNVNENQEPKNGDDIIFGAPKPTASSTTETNKDEQQKINPDLVGKDQTRLNRDTQEQKTKDLSPVPTPVEVDATKDIKLTGDSSEVSSTTPSYKLTTKLPENVKTTQELERNVKGHHFGHQHAVPLPYVN